MPLDRLVAYVITTSSTTGRQHWKAGPSRVAPKTD